MTNTDDPKAGSAFRRSSPAHAPLSIPIPGPRTRGTMPQRALAIAISVVALAATVVLSPVLLLVVQRIFSADWQALSAIGQSYTGISTLFSAAALLAAVFTIRLQVRQSQVAQEHALRETQFQLLALALQDDDLLEVVPLALPDGANRESKRQFVFLTMGLRHLQFLYLTKELSDSVLEGMLRSEFFANPRACRHWAFVRHHWAASVNSSRERTFVATAERVWESFGEAG